MVRNYVHAPKRKLDTPPVNLYTYFFQKLRYFGLSWIGFYKKFSDSMPYFTEFHTAILDYQILIPNK